MLFSLSLDGKSVDFCYKNDSPVLGGVDMVQFFTAFKLRDGSYNESEVGQHGSDLHTSVYNNYTYNFVSKANKRSVHSHQYVKSRLSVANCILTLNDLATNFFLSRSFYLLVSFQLSSFYSRIFEKNPSTYVPQVTITMMNRSAYSNRLSHYC
jgi:hypothetical protein